MEPAKLKQEIERLRQLFGDFQPREFILLNLIEGQNKELEKLKQENQLLKDENNHLKGEQGKPNFKAKTTVNQNISSEKERRGEREDKDKKKKKRNKRKKDLIIHDEKMVRLDKSGLPEDLQFKGYVDTVVQGIKFEAYNVNYKREKYYSPSTQKTYIAPISSEFYSYELQVLIIELHFSCNMSEPKILELLNRVGVVISAGTISNIILNNGKEQAVEREAVKKAGLSVSQYVQTDTTGCVENGVEKQSHNFNSACFSVFYTTADRKRVTIIDILRDSQTRLFALNGEFFDLVNEKNISECNINYLKCYAGNQLLTKKEIEDILSSFPENGALYTQLYDLAYIAGYHSEEGYPITWILLTDDASIYDCIALIHALCWVHEGRHFKKLNPLVPNFKDALDTFLTQFWDFYRLLLDYKQAPSEEYAALLEQKIEMTYKKKEELLVVIKYPFVPLHNNESELAARKITRQRDVSFQTKNKDGTLARDVFFSIISTCKKLGVNFYEYLLDRISGKLKMTSLADLILNFHFP